ncbi:MAG TPA: NAD(P)/FAD-dependent oxidoreductase [Asanoa sp.]|jgi:putative flavoprotein involved in K+ transport
MSCIPVVVIGAGQAGLAVSHLLTTGGVEHVVLERGRVAERWAAYRWKSLRLLTPNWLSRLPGFQYTGPDSAGFMSAAEVAGYLRRYARHSGAPVVEGARVWAVEREGDRYRVDTGAGCWTADAVVVATGWCDVPRVPPVAAVLDPAIEQRTVADYHDATDLPDGGVLVVGASATGVQLADELVGAGRRVMLAVGSHTRMPRRYRGLDSMWWLDAMGVLERPLDGHPHPAAARAEPSMQLVGSTTGRDVDLRSLQDRGVGLVGRLAGGNRRSVRFADDLRETTQRADARLRELLRRIDRYAAAAGLSGEVEPPAPVRAVRIAGAVSALDLRDAGIRSVLWATGYRRAYPWLRVPVLSDAGEIRHVDGLTPAPGLHVVGARWQSRRSSSFLDGVRHDAATVVGRVLDQIGAGVSGRAA